METVFEGKTKKGKGILIRYPEIGDLEEMVNFINELSDEKTFIRYQGEHETLESEKKWLEGRLKEIEEVKVVHLLIFFGNELVGAGQIHINDKTEKHIGSLGITIARNFRGEGMGNLLMGLILKEAKKKLPGIKIITLEVFSANDVAKNLYRKFGFVEYGMLPNGVSRSGKFEDKLLMYKNI